MKQHNDSFGATLLACALFSVSACNGGRVDAITAEPAGGAITLWTDSTELFMEHPALIVGQPGTFAVHLTDVTDYTPLRSGRVTMHFTHVDGGAPVVAVQDAPRAPGIYGPAPRFERPGLYDLVIEIDSPQAKDTIRIQGLRVYSSADEAPVEETGNGGGISFLKEQQWTTPGFRTDYATRGAISESFDATGEILPAAGRFAIVAAPVGGMVETSGIAASPAPGQRVARGAALAIITPTLSDDGGGSAVSTARRELREAEDEHERAARLLAVEAIPQRRMREAEIRLDAAREALAGLGALGSAPDGKLTVRSPIAGVIAFREIVPGSRVDAGQTLFTVLDPTVLWLRVDVPAEAASRVGTSPSASFRIGLAERVHETNRLISVGSMVDARSRSVPVLFEITNTDGSVRVGSVATASIHTGQLVNGILVPVSALLDDDGRSIVYVQLDGETFERREVTVGPAQHGSVLVIAGLTEGERVVTGAAYRVRLASLSTAVPAQGHEH